MDRLPQSVPDPILAGLRAPREAYRRLGYLRASWPRPLGTRPAVGVAVCAIFRNEARYLPEWVTFHRLQGVERFYLYENRSTDDWRTELAPELDGGVVEVTDWPREPGQWSAYNNCLERHRRDTRWIAFIDVDEFLFSPSGRPLPEVLQTFNCEPGVVVNRRFYGTNGHRTPPDGLVIENYLLRARDDHPANVLVKSIVYPRFAVEVVSSHYFRLRGNPVDERRRTALHMTREPATTELLRINHYYAKSDQEFARKAALPRPDPVLRLADPETPTVDPDRWGIPPDDVRDELILQFRDQLRAALDARRARFGHGRGWGSLVSTAR